MQYSQNLRDMEKRGEAVSRQAWNMAAGILGTALGDLFTGASDKQIDHDANKAAEPLKEEVLKLCDDVKAQRKVQDQISDALPVFKPYAVIHEHDTEDNCHANDEG
jgi:Leu/Phe-tRNA-protein transferase